MGLDARGFAVLSLALALGSSGCGGAGEGSGLRDPSAGAPAMLVKAPANYGDPAPPLASDAPSVAARTVFERGLPPELRGQIRSDGWLDFAARAAAAIAYENEATPARSTLRWVLWRAGVTGVYDVAYANTWTLKGGIRRGSVDVDVSAEIDGDVARFVRKLGPRAEERIYGIARYASGGTSTSQAILVAAVPVEVEPFAKSWAPGSDVTIAIKDLRGHKRPMLYADLGAEVRRLVMEARGAGAAITFKAPTTPGRVMIEVRADRKVGGRGPVTVLHAPLWVGVPEPTTAREFLGPPATPQPTGEAMAAAIRATYDAARSRAGAAPFGSDARLTALAAGWAERMTQSGAGPVSNEELRQAGFDGPFSVHEENLKASDYGDYAAIQLTSPYMKSLLLEKQASIAVAVVPIAGEAGGRFAVVEALTWPK